MFSDQSFARLVQQRSTIHTRIVISSLGFQPISDLRSYYITSRTSDYHFSDSRGHQGSRSSRSVVSQSVASHTAAPRITASRAVTNPRSDRTYTPCLGRFPQWTCSCLSFDQPDIDMAAKIQHIDLRSQGSMLKKRLNKCNLRLGRGPRSEEDFQRLLTDFLMFTHALLKLTSKGNAYYIVWD